MEEEGVGRRRGEELRRRDLTERASADSASATGTSAPGFGTSRIDPVVTDVGASGSLKTRVKTEFRGTGVSVRGSMGAALTSEGGVLSPRVTAAGTVSGAVPGWSSVSVTGPGGPAGTSASMLVGEKFRTWTTTSPNLIESPRVKPLPSMRTQAPETSTVEGVTATTASGET